MGNHKNCLSMNKIVIDTKNLKESLVKIFAIDQDFNEVAEELSESIIKENEQLSDMIECILSYDDILSDDENDLQFITMSSICKEYSYEIVTVSETEYVLVLAMIL
jgi:hypothetical protein